ncbi:unnamed protein product [Clavelina lepadiformis]|uniref:Uncharacterized protein n=1 Tax=Clavelina lepadiformis TaxID=159417 RepID=A0ABP0GBU3_CLALP
MTDCLQERLQDLRGYEECDDLRHALKVLETSKGFLDHAFSKWQERYKDVIDPEELDDSVTKSTSSSDTEEDKTVSDDSLSFTSFDNDSAFEPCENVLRRRKSSRISPKNGQTYPDKEYNKGWRKEMHFTDQFISEHEDEYFEVTPSKNDDKEIDDFTSSWCSLLKNLEESKRQTEAKCDLMQDTISDVSKAVDESRILRERIGMTHRSLTLLEMRQEKMMREALYENVSANCFIRRLQEEVIQLRIRETQHQSDIQRLVAENSRLKLKLMEAKSRFSGVTRLTNDDLGLSTAAEKVPSKYKSQKSSPGLSDIDVLQKPVCTGAVHRGSLTMFKDEIRVYRSPPSEASSSIQPESPVPQSTVCPLCNRQINDDILYDFDDEPATRTVGTSTADLENQISLRRTISIFGLTLPIPLFVACFLRAIEDSMLLIGRFCFAELPIDPTFPELQGEFMKALRQVHERVKEKLQR